VSGITTVQFASQSVRVRDALHRSRTAADAGTNGRGTAAAPQTAEVRGVDEYQPTGLPEQGALFETPDLGSDSVLIGYRGPTACSAAGISYRQLDYWARTDLVVPTIRSASGSGSQRLYSFKDILVLKVVKRLLDTGVSLQNIRVAVDALRARGVDDLAHITLLSDGTTVYECTSSEEVVDLLRGGQGVFGIAVSGALRELRGSLAQMPGERADGGELTEAPAAGADDELSQRRQRRTASA
jgi:DNA-binding transcriptional MerR regulator